MLLGDSGGSKNSLGGVCRTGLKNVCLQCLCVLFFWSCLIYFIFLAIEIANVIGISSRPGGLQSTRP